MAVCAPLGSTDSSFQTNSSGVTTFMASCAIKAGTAKLISPARVRSKRTFIIFSWFRSPDDLLRDFSDSRNVHVARGQKECLGQGPLSDSERKDQVCSGA